MGWGINTLFPLYSFKNNNSFSFGKKNFCIFINCVTYDRRETINFIRRRGVYRRTTNSNWLSISKSYYQRTRVEKYSFCCFPIVRGGYSLLLFRRYTRVFMRQKEMKSYVKCLNTVLRSPPHPTTTVLKRIGCHMEKATLGVIHKVLVTEPRTSNRTHTHANTHIYTSICVFVCVSTNDCFGERTQTRIVFLFPTV